MTNGHWTLRIFAGAGRVTSQISTQLLASKSSSVTGSADKKWWVLLVPVLVRLPVRSTSDEVYRFQSVQTTGGCCSCEETPSVVASDQPYWSWNLHQRPFHWWDCWGTCSSHVPVKLSRNPPLVVPVISPVLILEPSPEAFPLVGLLGVPVPVCTNYRWVLFLWRNPFSGCHWSPLFDPGTSTRGLPTGGTVGVPVPVMFLWSCQGTPLQWLPVISPVLILEPPPEAFPLVWLLGVPVPVLFRPPVRLLRGFTYQKSPWPLRPLSSLCRILDRYRSCLGYR